jgi:hypothetical protein
LRRRGSPPAAASPSNYGHDKLAAEANFINGITLSINGGKYLS